MQACAYMKEGSVSILTAEQVQAQLREFIQRGVSDALNASGVRIQSLTPELANTFVADIYQSAFEILSELGKSEAGE